MLNVFPTVLQCHRITLDVVIPPLGTEIDFFLILACKDLTFGSISCHSIAAPDVEGMKLAAFKAQEMYFKVY